MVNCFRDPDWLYEGAVERAECRLLEDAELYL